MASRIREFPVAREFPEPREIPVTREFPRLKLFPPVSRETGISREFPARGFPLNICNYQCIIVQPIPQSSQLIVTVEFTTAGDESTQHCEEHTSTTSHMYSVTANCMPEYVDECNKLH